MFEDIMESLDGKVLGISLVLSLFFIGMVWSIPSWKDYSFVNKVLITIILPVVSYFIVLIQTNR